MEQLNNVVEVTEEVVKEIPVEEVVKEIPVEEVVGLVDYLLDRKLKVAAIIGLSAVASAALTYGVNKFILPRVKSMFGNKTESVEFEELLRETK